MFNLDGVQTSTTLPSFSNSAPAIPSGSGVGALVATIGAQPPGNSTTISAAQPSISSPVSGATASVGCVGYGSVGFSVKGSYTGAVVAFDLSDDNGITWYPSVGSLSGMYYPQPNYSLTANSSVNFSVPVGPATNIRIRALALTSGSFAVIATLAADAWMPGIQNSQNYQSSVPFTSLNAATSAPTTGSALIMPCTCTNWSMQISATGGPNVLDVTLFGSLDGTNWSPIPIGRWSLQNGQQINEIISIATSPILAVYALLCTLAGGTSPTVTAKIAGM